MEHLPSSVKAEFKENGIGLCIRPHANRYSAIPINQAHENNNEIAKGSRGAVGHIENPSAFRKWMFAGPEHARILEELEKNVT